MRISCLFYRCLACFNKRANEMKTPHLLLRRKVSANMSLFLLHTFQFSIFYPQISCLPQIPKFQLRPESIKVKRGNPHVGLHLWREDKNVVFDVAGTITNSLLGVVQCTPNGEDCQRKFDYNYQWYY